jgi:mannose-6-phosphate isomerase-like protein (cupin superfamily)
MKSALIFLFMAALSAGAADAPAFSIWTLDNARQIGKDLAGKLNSQGLATQKLADLGNYNFGLTLRRQSGGAEVHLKTADIFVIEGGEADLITGGAVVDAKNSSATEVRGSAIQGGTAHHVIAGDVMTIPAGMPHQMKLAPGKEVLYMAIKVLE